MTSSRLLAIGFIYGCSAFAWLMLGASVVERTGESDERLAREVAQLWGGRHEQVAPKVWIERPRSVEEQVTEKGQDGKPVVRTVSKTVTDRDPLPLASSRAAVDLRLDPRRKGLLWYATYAVAFDSSFRVVNPDAVERVIGVHFDFPSPDGLFDDFRFRVDGVEAPAVADLADGLAVTTRVPPGAEALVEIGYRSRGLGAWTYSFGPKGVSQARDFALTATTDFDRIDFPAGTLSPTSKTRSGSGWKLDWRFASLVTGQEIGVEPPRPINPGPLTARVTFFAPVSLLFFVTVSVVLGVLRGRSLHPMNYFFIAAAFFSYHLLLAYLVDHVDVHLAFAIASLTSIFLVASYVRLVSGLRAALLETGFAQLVYLVLFSYAFFFEGYAGLTVTIGAVVTLFVLMQLTGRLDWERALRKEPAASSAS